MKNISFRALGALATAFLLFIFVFPSVITASAQSAGSGVSGLPVPRFVSLKSDRVNVRMGPSRSHDIGWTFVRSRLPVEIIQEYDDWRRIRDWEGKEGWVFKTLLTGYRSALVTPWLNVIETTPLRKRPGPNEPIKAYLEPLVLAGVVECIDGYCRISGKDFEGWIDQSRLFGVYKNETINN
ncbi:SH3 domain-containing protein [Pseudovibrio sp. Tun.PSC04-5.I4]|uniref:SH3 domain-containing protein n=1 Tax=Pseudovibrio sp. Tun.PSC04-5.I4 TaxID=1798213 RepID=UPI0008850837|nr:SH3 domain-containing protein [Pseudovibrio sp. Tun.PSC04-5.I4]SDR26441.1 SH3-like domain-containing protein [Pseudovibrio sp. Tun.PSC04-5.I4]